MAIYWYYPSKDALLDAVVGRWSPSSAARRRTRTRPPPANVATPADFIDALRTLAPRTAAWRTLPERVPLLASRRFTTEGDVLVRR
ncbi:MAG: hypothetical protein KF850_06835 [Labilithrix sp.]|nr:hypothetical protein [Labilithrix sp.]